MTRAFNPRTHWPTMADRLGQPDYLNPNHGRVLAWLRRLLPTLKPIDSILDVGCGIGRLASLLAEVLPDAYYSGLDIGKEQAAATRLVRPDGSVYVGAIQDFAPGHQYDLVLASEVLMHIPPDEIQAVCDKLKRLARRYVVTVDWTQPLEDTPTARWNWQHDYWQLFGTVEHETVIGLQSVLLIRPGLDDV